MLRCHRSWVLAGLIVFLTAATAEAVTITFDYTYDTTNFFNGNTTANATLTAAGNFFSTNFQDTLDAIVPSGSNTWNATFFAPNSGSLTATQDLNVPADTLIVYVGARDLGGPLGVGGPGGWNASGNQTWFDTLTNRGETATELIFNPGPAVVPRDFGPWGGSLSFDSNATWNLDHTTAPSGGQNDLYSVVLHELAHLLGIGTADSWNAWVSSGNFTGPDAVASYGGNVPLHGDNGHFASGTMSAIWGTETSQEALLTPSLLVGTRRLMTDLDMAALSDIGWEVAPVPEPSTLAFLAAGALVLAGRRFRRAKRR